MKEKNDIPVYTGSAKELKDEINARIAEVMRENFADSSYRVAPIKPIGINGIEYDNIAISKDDRGVPYMYLSSHANYDVNLQRIDKLPDSTSLLKEILQKVNDSYYTLNGAAVKAKPDLHKFLEGEYVQFKIKSGKETDHDIRGRVNKVGNVRNMSHIFGSPAVEIKGENFFIDDIKEDSLMVQSHINAVPSNQLDIDKTNKELSSFAIKDFDIKCDVGVGNGNGEYYNIDTIHVRNRQLDSVSGSHWGYEYDEREVAVPAEGVFSNNITSFMNFINENHKKDIMFAVASKLPYMRIWADEVAREQHAQEKADRVSARMGRLLALMPDPGDSMSFKKPLALDDYISTDGIGDMKITEIRNAGDGRFTVSDGERVIPFGRMMEWDQASVVTMCEQLDKKQNNDVANQMEDNVNRQPETQKAQEAEEFEDVDNERVLSDADIASPKHQIREAIVERILNPSSDATFTKEQQDTIISYLKDYPTVDGKLQALSPLWQDAEQDSRVKGEPKEWFEPVKEELNDLASGIRREPSEGMKLK